MNKAELVAAVVASTGFKKSQIERTLESIQETTVDALRRGEDVRLVGFGTYSTKVREQREARNPQTGERVTVAARKVVKFKPAEAVSGLINKR